MNLPNIIVESNTAPLVDHAINYCRRGDAIISVIWKRAAESWRQYQRHPADEATLRRMFSNKDATGLAIISGAVSRGRVVRDWDERSAYRVWAAKNQDLAGKLPTVRTARCFHVHCRGPEFFQKLPDGEYRGTSGCYTLLPPSRHPDGSIYCWTIPLPAGDLPYIPDPVAAGLVPSLPLSSPPSNPPTQSTHVMCEQGELPTSIREIITATLPTGPGQRNRKLFDLARKLKALNPVPEKEELRTIVRVWHALALETIRTKAFAESWEDFCSSWLKVKSTVVGRWNEITKAAAILPAPEGFDGAGAALVNLCAVLNRHHQGRPFPLSCRCAADAIGVSHRRAATLLKMLVFEEIIELTTEAGPKSSRRAAEYRFLGAK